MRAAVETVMKKQKNAKYTKRIFATLRDRFKPIHSKGLRLGLGLEFGLW